jgi:hypothetical protein
MTTFQIEKNKQGVFAHFKGANINRTIRCPEKKAKKVKSVYYSDKTSAMKYNIPVLNVDGKIHTCHELMLGRVWNTLWEDGWRKK